MRIRSFDDQIKFNLAGFPPYVGPKIAVAGSAGSHYSWLRDSIGLGSEVLRNSIPDAVQWLTGEGFGNLYLTPDNHTLTASLTWALNNSRLVGLGPELMMNHRARIGHNFVASPLITVSGYGNEFKNIYTMHGYGTGADYIGWTISGARNLFDHVHFGGPMQATQAGHASYEGIALDGSENFFRSCVFGTDTIGRDEATPNVTLGAGSLSIFENCVFLVNLTDGDPVFIKAENTSGYTWALFKNCMFMAFNSNYATPMTKAVECTGESSCALVFDPSCQFQNVTALADATDDAFVWYPVVFSTTTDTAANIMAKLAV